MQNFSNFLSEAKGEDFQLRVIMVTTVPDANQPAFRTASHLETVCKERNVPFFGFDVERGSIEWADGIGSYVIRNRKDQTGFKVGPGTLCIVRGNVRHNKGWFDKVSQFEKSGCTMVNAREVAELCNDKYRCYLRLQDFGLTQPRTVLIPNEEDDGIQTALENLDRPFPIIMKTLEGSEGVGVVKIDSESSLKAFIQLIYKQDEAAALLIQEYIEMKEDYRVHVLDGKIIASMTRGKVKGDFRSNVTQGGDVNAVKLTKLEVEQCLLAAKAVDGRWVAVDFIPSKDREKEPPFILEVNHSPGTKGIESAMAGSKEKGDKEHPLLNLLIDHFSQKKFHWSHPTQVGYIEMVTIEPFGQLTAKLDTGNYRYPVLHADKYKIEGKNITFTSFGKTIKTKLIGDYVSKTMVGEDERPLVKLNYEFAGKKYGEITFGLDERDGLTTDVLLNRRLMNKMNVMVNPNRKFVRTTAYEAEEKD